jgi:hypothetical protein
MIDRGGFSSGSKHHLLRERAYRSAGLAVRFGATTSAPSRYSLRIVEGTSSRELLVASVDRRFKMSRPAAKRLAAKTAVDASDSLNRLLSAAVEKNADERYSFLHHELSEFLERFGNLGLVEVAFELKQLRYPEDVLGDVLEALGDVGDYQTLRFRRAIVSESLNSPSPYLRFAAVSAADDVGVDFKSIQALLDREEIPELRERASRVVSILRRRATP